MINKADQRFNVDKDTTPCPVILSRSEGSPGLNHRSALIGST
jgi:hypothetical protein